jgi:hypothetical protein
VTPEPDAPFNRRCTRDNYGKPCGRPRIHLGSGPRDVWLCPECDMGAESADPRVPAYVRPGPPRLVHYIRTGERQ